MRQGFELGRPRKVARRGHLRVAGALIIGLSTFQAEFDFGVPQFQLLYQPVLIAFAAARRARVRALDPRARGAPSRRSGCSSSSASRWPCSSARSPGYTTPHFPLYIAEAAVVEARRARRAARAAALRAAQRAGHRDGRPRGRVGLEPRLDAPSVAGVDARARASSWPWPPALAGSVLGARMSQSLAMPEQRARRPAGDRAAGRRAGGRRRTRGALLPAAAHRRRRHARVDRPDARRRRARRRRRQARSAHRGARQPVVRDPLLAGAHARPAAPAHRAAPGRAGPLRHRAPRAGDRQLEDDAAPGQGHAPHGPAGVPAALAAGQPGRRSRAPALGRDAAPTPSSCSARRAAAPRG